MTEVDAPTRQQRLEQFVEPDPAAAFADVQRERVVLSLCPELADLAAQLGKSDLVAEIRGFVALHRSMRELSAKLRERVAHTGIAATFVKGEAISKFYPRGRQRQCLDIDIIVENIGVFWDVARLFLLLGGRFAEFGLFRSPSDGEVAGNAVFTFHHDDDNRPTVWVDILIRCQQIFAGSSWPVVEPLFANRIPDKLSVTRPSARDIAFQVIEISDNAAVTVRDALDVMYLLRASEIDTIQDALAWVTRLGGRREFDRVLASCEEIATFRDEVQQLRKRLDLARCFWNSPGDSFVKRLIFQRLGAKYPTAFTGFSNLNRSILYELLSSHYARRPSISWLADAVRRRLCPRRLFNSGHLVRFFILPVHEKHRDALQWRDIHGRLWLQTPLAAMIPASFGIAEEDDCIAIAQTLGGAPFA